jgi:hypothetical protein
MVDVFLPLGLNPSPASKFLPGSRASNVPVPMPGGLRKPGESATFEGCNAPLIQR